MLEKAKQHNIEKKEEKILMILFIPLMFVIGIVPLIVRFKEVQASQIVYNIFRTDQFIDFYSQYKATFILASTIIMILTLFLLFDKYKLKKARIIKIYMNITAVFAAFTVLAAVLSPYKDVALWGVPDRAEGMIIILCYITIMLYTIYAFQNVACYKYIIYSLGVVVTATTILGISQYIGRDLTVSSIGRQIIIPSEFAEMRELLVTNFEKARITGTMFNPNYIGSFTAMMIPLFMTLAFFIKGKKTRVLLSIMSLCSLFVLFGSGSRAGILGSLGAVFCLGIIFVKKVWYRKRLIIPIGIVAIIGIVGAGIATKGIMFSKVTSLAEDSLQIFTPQDTEFDYRDKLPIRDLVTNEGKLIVTTQEEALTLENTLQGINFTDSEGNKVDYQIQEDIYITKDVRFSNLKFQQFFRTDDTSKIGGIGLVENEQGLFVFQVSDEEGIYLVDTFTQQPIKIEFPDTIGFKGKERLGSARGYIWSRSLPMIKETFIIGHGPDTYVFKFPQRDYLGKYYALGDPNKVVDKPHNLYLQIAINQGMIALISFIILVVLYIVDSFRLYALKICYTKQEIIGIATMSAIVGYLIAGIFNDSVVSVAPIFWVLIGVGIAINYINTEEKAVINYK